VPLPNSDELDFAEMRRDLTGVYLHFEELFQTDDLALLSLFCGLSLRFQDKAWRKGVSVLALITIWAFPEPAEPAIMVA
jgi:hypothetical protein